jgi:hypothetical protein
MAGAMTAPRDGTGPVGVAWRANLYNVRFNGDVATFDAWNAVDAIYMAGGNSKIVVMAWGAPDWWNNSIEAAIDHFYYNRGVLFVGAAGSTGACVPEWMRANTIFPAEMEEVVAAAGLQQSGDVACNSHFGPGVDVAAFVKQPTPGTNNEVWSFEASSNAAAVIGGAAALIWSYYGGSRDQVIQKLYESGSLYPNRSSRIGYGAVNVAKAVGALWNISFGSGYLIHVGDTPVEHTFYVGHQGGAGPFEYNWGGPVTNVPYYTRTFYPTQDVRYESIHVSVKDLSDGSTLHRDARITVMPTDPSGCPSCAQ